MQTEGTTRTIASLLGFVTPLLGLAFVVAGGLKLQDPGSVVELFASWGLGAWAIAPAAWIEVVVGLALFHGPTRRAGAAAMVAWMVLFGSLQLRAGQFGPAGASGTVALLCAGVLLVGRRRAPSAPHAWIPAPLLAPPRKPAAAVGRLAELVGVSFLIRWAIGGVLFWSALPLLGWAHARTERHGNEPRTVEAILLYLLVLGLGVSGIWAFVGHYFMSDTVAASVGWQPGSPFQRELAFYHLGLGCAGLACLWIRDRFWLATGLIATVFLYGAGLVHVESFLASGNTAPANWGFAVLFGNGILPTVLLGLLAARRHASAVHRQHLRTRASIHPGRCPRPARGS